MLPEQKLLDILSRLLEKSRSGQVVWKETKNPNEFVVTFSESTLAIRYTSPPTESDFFLVMVKNHKDKELWRLTVEERDSGWPVVQELFLEAKRRAVGLDGILEKIETELGGQREVGDIPF